MFKRRKKHSFFKRVKELFWPSMGLRRLMRYYHHRVGRMPGTPYYIAAGFASGIAVSFTPFIGFHIILGILLAFIVRGSLVSAVVGTLFGNPWTIPFILFVAYKIGIFVIGADMNGLSPIDLTWDNFSLEQLFSIKLFLPMTIGGMAMAIASWAIVFFPMRDIVKRYQKRRRKRLRRIKKTIK